MRSGPDVRPQGTVCPICLTWYSAAWRTPGTRCDDLSQGQERPCVGRVIPAGEFERAEWRRNNPAYRYAHVRTLQPAEEAADVSADTPLESHAR
jgi:hypothetical protein